MKPKLTSDRKFEAQIVQLHHASGRQRDELVARLLYQVLQGKDDPKPKKNSKPKKRPSME